MKMKKILITTVCFCFIFVGYQNCAPMSSSTNSTDNNSQGTPPGDDPTDTTPDDTPIDTSFCAATKTVSNGTLCAVKPSGLDSRTKDVNTLPTNPDYGFGYHAIAIPTHYDPNKGLWIHFTGTAGRPYNQKIRKSSFDNYNWLDEIMSQGYTVIQLAYDNAKSVNDICQHEGLDHDNCAGEVREEILTGVPQSLYVDTDAYNSVDYRLQVLLTYLKLQASVKLPSTILPTAMDWSQVTVSGHSQGGNHAYYIAKNRGVRFACMLASPYDTFDKFDLTAGAIPIADWFTTGGSATPVSRMGQFATKEDDQYSTFNNTAHIVLGMKEGQESFSTDLATEGLTEYHDADGKVVDGHAAAVHDPSLASLRAQACF